jgi:hypothetical protein
MTQTDKPDFLIHLRALPRTGPVVNRLRRFLKSALRVWGFRVVSVQEVPLLDAAPVSSGGTLKQE